jgi:DNA-binding transcriptional ArsR family regulator
VNPETFAALAHDIRLTVFRLLLEKGPAGLPAGQIALRLQVPASTLSAHLARLERAGLLRSWREQRRILYAVDVEGTRKLVGFLVDDCCGGEPELCGIARRDERKVRRKGDPT